jgi:formate hydrogenlyase subunit 3/multisubunit Na+/H+ antiporter MnhD subunit
MNQTILMLLIMIPAALGLLFLVIRVKSKYFQESIGLICSGYLLYLVITLWGRNVSLNIPWAGFGINLQFRFYPFSQFISAAIAGITFLIVLFSIKYMENHPRKNTFYALLFISEAMSMGAVLANNLVVMLFFWESILITLFSMINLGKANAYRTGIKAFVIVGLSDLCLMLGIAIVGAQAGTLVMSYVHLSTTGINGVAFVLMLIGAMAKAGAMPFHTWIYDAAIDAPLPFMALMSGALEKLLGIYLLARVSLDFFTLTPGMKIVMMSIGGISIIFAVMMALIQKNIKKQLSYHAVSQVGYMILGVGVGVPIGVVGGVYHMINNVINKSGLFLIAGAVEKQTGTTDLNYLGGLRKRMPFTFWSFVITACSISGVPPFNGFVSMELIMKGTLESGYSIFFAVAVIGAIFTAASFLKLGHAVFFGKTPSELKKVNEVHWSMLIPMVILAVGGVLFGVWRRFPLNYLIKPALAFSLFPQINSVHSAFGLTELLWVSIISMSIAFFNHLLGVKLSGSGLGALEHIHQAKGLRQIYDLAEGRIFDIYVQGRKIGRYLARGLLMADQAVDWLYQTLIPWLAWLLSSVCQVHTGLYSNYLIWSLLGLIFILIFIVEFI